MKQEKHLSNQTQIDNLFFSGQMHKISRGLKIFPTESEFGVKTFFFGTQRRRSHFSLPVLALIFPACSLVSSHLLRDSLCTALQTEKIMDLINWSLNAIDTIFSTRSLGSGEPDCPDGTFAAGYTMEVWERWRIVCLAALSVEDIEDIYLFGTMITGLLLIGLGFALGY